MDNGFDEYGVCEYADIKRGVIRGCIGDGSCSRAGTFDGHVGRIQDGCVGDAACKYLGASGGYEQTITVVWKDIRAS